ncbi:MAG: hypothetical protein QM778_28160 [Myxococcales bacterium]
MLEGRGYDVAYSAWIDFSSPTAPARLDSVDVSTRLWHQSSDRRYQLRGALEALHVIDLVDAQSRAVVPADASIPVPAGDDMLMISREGHAAFLAGPTLYWLDLHTGILTASVAFASPNTFTLVDGNTDLSRILGCIYQDLYFKVVSITPSGETITLHDDSTFGNRATCMGYWGNVGISPDGLWAFVDTSTGDPHEPSSVVVRGRIVSMDGSSAPVVFPDGFSLGSFDRTSRYVLGGYRGAEGYKVAVWSWERPVISDVAPAGWATGAPIWVP